MPLIFCAEVHATENPLTKRPGLASRCFQESIWNTEQINRKKIMKVNEPDNTHTPSKAKVRMQPVTDDLHLLGCSTSNLTTNRQIPGIPGIWEGQFYRQYRPKVWTRPMNRKSFIFSLWSVLYLNFFQMDTVDNEANFDLFTFFVSRLIITVSLLYRSS